MQLIDWNMASSYFPGYESNEQKGTECYHSPESILGIPNITPASDVWSLAVVYFFYVTGKRPFLKNCEEDELAAVISLVGG